MFFKFKIVKDGLKYLGTCNVADNKKNIIYMTEEDLNKISPEVITNFNSIKVL